MLRHRHFLKNGKVFSLLDLKSAFDWRVLETYSRARPVDYIFSLLDIRFRMFFFRYLPFHPSLSLTWLFTILLNSFILFRLCKYIFKDVKPGWLTVSLYLISIGHLSTVAEFNRPAKPLVLFFISFLLLLLYRSSRNGRLSFLFLVTTLFALFTDETAFFIFIPLALFWNSFFKKGAKHRVYNFISIGVIGTIFLLGVGVVLPQLHEWAGYPGYNFFRDVFQKQVKPDNIKGLVLNFYYLVASHLSPFVFQWQTFYILPLIFLTASFSFFLFLFNGIKEKMKRLEIKRILAFNLLYVVFHILIMRKHMGVSQYGAYYYGSIFSVLISLLLGSILSQTTRLNSWSKSIASVLLILLFFTNFIHVEKGIQNYFSVRNSLKLRSRMVDERTVTYSMVQEVWEKRDREDQLIELVPRFPKRTFWLFEAVQFYEPYRGFDVKNREVVFKKLFEESLIEN